MVGMHIQMVDLFIFPGNEPHQFRIHFADENGAMRQDVVCKQSPDFFEWILPVEECQVRGPGGDENAGNLGGILRLGMANRHSSDYSPVR